jgi:hypothetical protein
MRYGYRRLVLVRASFQGHLDTAVRALVAVGVGAALSACGGSGSTTSQGPGFPYGPWPAFEKVDFLEGCESSGLSVRIVDSYCTCALSAEMRRRPDARNLPGGAGAGAGVAGGRAAQHKQDFPDCAGR